MKYRPLGRTGVKVSELCLGAMMFGGRTPDDEGVAIIDKAIDAGINFIDTANVYSRGRSEEVRRRGAEAPRPARLRWSSPPRCTAPWTPKTPTRQGNSRRHIIQQCEASLRRLQTDWIDLYQIHRPQSDIPIDETLRALDDLVRVGQGALHRHQHLRGLAAGRVALGVEGAGAQPLRLRAAALQPARPAHRARAAADGADLRHGIIPWSPLGRRPAHRQVPARRCRCPRTRATPTRNSGRRRRLTERVYDVVEAAAAARRERRAARCRSWRWPGSPQQPGVTSPIIGPRTMEQFEDNLGALNVELSEEDLKFIDSICRPGDTLRRTTKPTSARTCTASRRRCGRGDVR